MTDNSIINSTQASGGKVWNPYSGTGTLPRLSKKSKRTFTLWQMLTAEIILILSFVVSLIPTYDKWNLITNPAAHHISNGSYYSTDVGDASGILFYSLSAVLLFMAGYLAGFIVKTIYKNNTLNLVLKIFGWVSSFVIIAGLIFMPMKSLFNLLEQDSYDNWIKEELGVSELIYLQNDFIQGKNGVYKVDQKKENGYYKFTVKKVEL